LKHSEFKVGNIFAYHDDEWRITDVGARTVVAIKLSYEKRNEQLDGPPYQGTEVVFSERQLAECETRSWLVSKEEIESYKQMNDDDKDAFIKKHRPDLKPLSESHPEMIPWMEALEHNLQTLHAHNLLYLAREGFDACRSGHRRFSSSELLNNIKDEHPELDLVHTPEIPDRTDKQSWFARLFQPLKMSLRF
jgi:hypothetical protein